MYDDDGDGYCESPPCIGSNAATGLQSDADVFADCDDDQLVLSTSRRSSKRS